MNRRKPSFTPALCISLIAHGLGLSGMAWWIIMETPPQKLAALDRNKIILDSLSKTLIPAPLHPPASKITPPPKPPAPEKKKPPEKIEKPQVPMKDDSGEAHGVGTANRSTDGKQPMLANAGLEQADLMKDADHFANDALLPASKGDVHPNEAPPQKSPQQGVVSQHAAETNPVKDPSTNLPVVQKPDDSAGPLPTLPASAAQQPGTKVPQPRVSTASVDQAKPVQKEIRGHKATISDTESIAFAKADNVTFRAGKVEGREGLKVKSTMPRFGLASEVDLANLGALHLVLGVTVDPDGTPQNVEILQSSGSENVDLDCKNEVYNHWSLEPKKDKDGHPIDLTWVVNFE